MRRVLRHLGYLRGQTRNALAESSANVAYRAWYIRTKLSNRTHGRTVIQPEINLDESFCNLHHVAPRSWLDSTQIRYGPSAKKSDQDYHGNFDAEQFERWFFDLCKSAAFQIAASINHLDGARYHKRVLNPQPVARWRKSEIQDWLRGRGISYGLSMVKAELLELARHNREPPHYACVAIARSWGHCVLFTPPYHPELQPIEKIWAVGKNTIARAPALTMAELSAKISSAFQDHVSERTWLGAFTKVQRFEDKYLSFIDVDIVADHNDSADEGMDNDCALADALLAEDAEFLE
ncbi:hypothetical protein ACHHYP_20832 [Achlya hypogyna]|uniref:Tc1-like transposase DDE domain-containing protein n=1 Tax=Achlya hypogyna TaxID=1202772 RepID=A0A1V9Y5R9_ACHHY|nr:hypothetical protein ACHHYP_20832 [Achlya hypogyna]